jgi:hypothetical protein
VTAVSFDAGLFAEEGTMRQVVQTPRASYQIAARTLVLVVVALLMLTPSYAFAQTDGPPVCSVVLVANTDGQRLNLRAGPAPDQPIVARLNPGDVLSVTGPGRTIGVTLWVPVQTKGNQSGWVSAQFVVLLTPPAPATSPVAETAPTRPSTTAKGESTERANLSQRVETKGGPIDIEAKLKFPEARGRDQEITVVVTRDGVPVPGAVVTLETSDGDDDERFRQLDPTDADGRTQRVFDVRHEKGTVELQVEAVAPDGGEGRTIVSYFRR